MAAATVPLPSVRPDLVIRPLGDRGAYVVKDPRTGAYYHVGEEEHFLLTQLRDGRGAAAVCAAFAERFGEPLTAEELDDFLETARGQGLLVPEGAAAPPPEGRLAPPPWLRGSLLFWRVRLFDPDRLFGRLAPALGFFWSRGFVAVSAGCIAAAAALVWLNRREVADQFLDSLHWRTGLLVGLTVAAVIALHESAHGLTCKHYGGEVREVGFLMLLLMPCFYCNVSDAWLFRQKSRRLWVTLAGGYFELFVWALAVFTWRLTRPGPLVHEVAFVVLTSCGVRTLFNFNPLVKLDGYYLLSDWAEIPNLQQRSAGYVAAHARRLLWGGEPPDPEPHGRFLVGYGLASLAYSLALLLAMLVGLFKLAGTRWGWLAAPAVLALAGWSAWGLFRGFTAGEVAKMLRFRRRRALGCAALVGLAVTGLGLVPVADRAGGPFVVRAAARAELRAPVAGFLHEVARDEGEPVHEGEVGRGWRCPTWPAGRRKNRPRCRRPWPGSSCSRRGPGPRRCANSSTGWSAPGPGATWPARTWRGRGRPWRRTWSAWARRWSSTTPSWSTPRGSSPATAS
jgi:hypothetical protein